MSTFVLIHGAMHGGWCWDKVVPLLKKEGHKVIAPDLPGSGADRTPIKDISLKSYTDTVCKILDAQPEPVILAGHSLGGVTITQTAEYKPDKIRVLVYLAALLLQSSQTAPQALEGDTESLFAENRVMAEDGSSFTAKEEAVRDIFYGKCSDEDVKRAKTLLRPQAAAPGMTAVNTTAENFGRVPRVYIQCLRDKALSPSRQKRMYTALPCERVLTMDMDHSPFFSAPEELVAHLTSL